LGDLRPGSDHDRVDAGGDRSELVNARIAFDLVCVRIDGGVLVASLSMALVDDVACVPR
jgi:hypothetical protein